MVVFFISENLMDNASSVRTSDSKSVIFLQPVPIGLKLKVKINEKESFIY